MEGAVEMVQDPASEVEEEALEMLGRFAANAHRLNSEIDKLNSNVLTLRGKMTGMEDNMVSIAWSRTRVLLAKTPLNVQMAVYMPFKSALYEHASQMEKVSCHLSKPPC
jgi:hypothetical protein